MFRNRINVLDELIELYTTLDTDLTDDSKSMELHCQIIKSFLHSEIENFSKTIIEDVLEIELFDFEFANKLFNFDRLMFQKKLQNSIKNLFQNKINFNAILTTISSFKYYDQAVMGYKMMFDMLNDETYHSKESYELSRKLQEMIAMPIFSQLTDEKRSQVTDMAQCLPLYPEDLGNISKLIITNLGSKCHLNMTMKNMDFGNFPASPRPTLTFLSTKFYWIVRHDRSKNIYEFETPNGLILCWVKPLPLIGYLSTTEVIFMNKNKATNNKWEIKYLEVGDPSKGFIIKAAGNDLYLRIDFRTRIDGSLFEHVIESRGLDLEQSEKYAWKFQQTQYIIPALQ